MLLRPDTVDHGVGGLLRILPSPESLKQLFEQADVSIPFSRFMLVPVVLTFLMFLSKVIFLSLVFIWVRWTLPRFRYDQLMDLGWKKLLPISMANLLFFAYRMRG